MFIDDRDNVHVEILLISTDISISLSDYQKLRLGKVNKTCYKKRRKYVIFVNAYG